MAVEIDHSRLFAQGAFKNVFKGTYIGGQRHGQPCVAKEFRTSADRYADPYFDEELRIVRRAATIVRDFSVRVPLNVRIVMNTPEIGTRARGQKQFLIEPMIRNFQKFNSNTGWRKDSRDDWTEVMQALSHFSYHYSNGQYLLCDLQGGIYSDRCILTDPAIISRHESYGPTDMGIDGDGGYHRGATGPFTGTWGQ